MTDFFGALEDPGFDENTMLQEIESQRDSR